MSRLPATGRIGLVLVLLLALLAPSVTTAQAPKIVRLGLLSPDATFADTSPLLAAFRQGLAERGWVEGKNVELVRRYSGGDRALFLGNSLVALGVDLIVAASTFGTRVARDATTTIPIVFVGVSDPVGSGLLPNLDLRRSGNLTGITDVDPRSTARGLAMLKQVAPTISRVALFANPAAPLASRYIAEVESAAPALGVNIRRRLVREPDEMKGALAAMLSDYDEAMVVLPDPLFNAMREPLVGFANVHRLPAVFGYRVFAPMGGLMTYGTDVPDLYRRAAGLVDRILKGAKPGDLPIEGPIKFHLAINLGAAQRMGLTIPDTLRRQADQIISARPEGVNPGSR
ncbi:MAG TPA: ABC transporter substrate-binding protein [Candidatus Acidoferrum sp.]|nr:ABC transporter substrate-binding protein [Candidatus Acidoferrum sp.]